MEKDFTSKILLLSMLLNHFRFTKEHEFEKPNDVAGLSLMNACAEAVFQSFSGDVLFAFGESDEFSFVIHKDSTLYERRKRFVQTEFFTYNLSKIATLFASCFASNYVFKWSEFFPNKKLKYPPLFDGRVVAYPSEKNLRDYLSWRQVDSKLCFENVVHVFQLT
jgi:tRNA(His) guanylyltransferase